MMEAQVHQILVAIAREQNTSPWPHHLTLARLVARGLRLGRSALIQTRTGIEDYALSYLTPALLSSEPVTIVVPQLLLTWLQAEEIPRLQRLLGTERPIAILETGDQTQPSAITLLTPPQWFGRMTGDRPPAPVTTILNPVDELWQWAQDFYRCQLQLADWEMLKQQNPGQQDFIQSQHDQLKAQLLRRSPNPYHCYPLDPDNQRRLATCFQLPHLPAAWRTFAATWQHRHQSPLCWAHLHQRDGRFSLQVAPQTLNQSLAPLWQRQPTLLIGSFLEPQREAPSFCTQIGLNPDQLTCVDFAPPRQQDQVRVYLPEQRLPLPNTPEFQGELLHQLRHLIRRHPHQKRPIVLLINDVPLQAQMGAALAAEFGSRVKVETANPQADSILICGWAFWRRLTDPLFYGQSVGFPLPQLMAIATLPLPSLENPLVAARVAQYKQKRQDWFRLYLLPTALQEMQRATYPLHQEQSVIAILDNRINHRAYGQQILDALQPCSVCNYLEPNWLGN
ncbi:helicase C-terminal domain-containing protein [Picosynechococcus sp. PCC 8807]|uniref:helicase C-terminal domain-containing protein n=1 Tax=Picosynechococcus sp. PCC 8807 TaxID=195248 RepID=UPI0008108590|nr:helicase C-terminal domain-containing protein [Picosynechococcus sp. PCC 8807]ANV90258.1 DNA helicase [Picosynechococcus sp. PCC 8807]